VAVTRPDPAAQWHDYLAAAQSLDAVRREAATGAAAATRTASAARAELAQVRVHLARQRAVLASRAARSGRRRLRLAAYPAERAAAGALAGADPADVDGALERCRELLLRADTRLGGRRSGLPRWWRAVAVGALAAVALAVLLAWFG
jgi:hypothetical protein